MKETSASSEKSERLPGASSRSRSLSKKKEQVRHFVISSSSSSSRSRSKSRGRKRSSSSSSSSSRGRSSRRRNSRHHKHSKHRRRSRTRSRSRSSSNHSFSGNEPKQRFGGSTNSTDPQSVASRIFIGNLPYDAAKEEIYSIYNKYGKILGMTILKGFAFVQFDKEEAAQSAVKHERGSSLKGFQLDVKLATEGRKKGEKEMSPSRTTEPIGYRPPPPPGDSFRGHGPPHGPPHAFFRPPMPGPFPPRPLPPPDHFRRHPFPEPFSDYPPFPPHPGFPQHPLPPHPPPPPSIDCEILVVDAKQRSYADSIKKRLMAAGIATEMNVLAPGIDILIALEEATQRRLLFAIVINEQNEVHRSITVNILHGLPQEHRNMPVDDAITLITRSFDKYVIDRRDRADSFGPPPPPLPGPPGPVGPELSFLPAGPRVQYLLNLLADQRFLTIAELTVVIDYLVERRRMMEPPPREREPSINRERFDDRDVGYPPEARRVDATEMRKSLDVDERERQSYLPPQRSLDISESRRISESVAPVPTPVPAASATTTPSNASLAQMINTSINFDNPTVRQALDNLIQSGPNLFRSLTDNAR